MIRQKSGSAAHVPTTWEYAAPLKGKHRLNAPIQLGILRSPPPQCALYSGLYFKGTTCRARYYASGMRIDVLYLCPLFQKLRVD